MTKKLMTKKMMQNRRLILKGIARGETAVREGRVLSHAEAKAKMSRWLK